MSHRHNDRMPAVRYSIHGHSPSPVQRIEADDDPRNGQESQRKQRKGRQQFAHKIELQRADDSQQPPHPFPVLILLLDGDLTATRTHRVPRFLKTLTSLTLDAATCPVGHVLNTCTIRHRPRPKNRWYASHILGSKRVY